MERIGQRIKQLRISAKLSQSEFARRLSVTQSSISRYESLAGEPDTAFLSKLCDRFHVNLNWLLSGEGEMYQSLYEIDSSILEDVITMPIVAEIAAGEPCEAILDDPLGYISFPRKLLYFSPPYHVFSVKGQSMEPHIRDKDIVICSQCLEGVDLNGKILAFRTADGITLKRMQNDEKNRISWLMPINHEFSPMPYDEDSQDIVMIGILDIAIRGYNRK